jgi:hypothetical protein
MLPVALVKVVVALDELSEAVALAIKKIALVESYRRDLDFSLLFWRVFRYMNE